MNVEVQDYNLTPIPLEILDLVALSIKEEYFDRIMIYYDDKSPDPACIAATSSFDLRCLDNKWSSHKDKSTFRKKEDAELYISVNSLDAQAVEGTPKYYLLGKWADVKQPLSALKEKAIKRRTEEQKISYQSTIDSYQSYLKNVENEVKNHFA